LECFKGSSIHDHFAVIYTENNVIRTVHILPIRMYQLTLRT